MTTKTNVLHILKQHSEKGGTDILLDDIIRQAQASNHKVLAWGVSCGGKKSERTADRILLTWKPSNIIASVRALIWADVLHVHLFPALYFCALLPKKKIFTEHNTKNRRRDIKFLKFAERIIYGCYEKIICISHATKYSLKDWAACPDGKLGVVYNGVDLDKYGAGRSKKKRDDNAIHIGMAARFVEQKDQATLIRAFSHLPQNYHLRLAGEGPRYKEIKDLATALQLDSRVTFLGFVQNMEHFYPKIDLYVQSSHWEGFGLPVIEAMAAGCPALGSDVPGLDEVIGNKSYLFSCGDAEQLAQKIREVCEDQHAYATAVNYSALQAQSFSILQTTKQYEQVYEFVANGI